MPIMELLYLCGVIVAFLAFVVTLAWGQYQTQNAIRPDESQSSTSADHQGFKKAA